MRVIELRASNFSRIRAVEIRPTGALVPITGKNGAGKTSCLNAIWTALKGRAAAPPQPIHEGAEAAIIKLDLGNLKITRTFKRAKDGGGEVTSDLVVTDVDGGRVRKTPQALIDGLLGDLSFDPLAFAKMKPADQFERLKHLVAGVDFDALAAERQAAYDKRTEANRRAREAQVLAERVALPDGPEPAAVNVGDKVMELGAATEHNSRRAVALAQIESLKGTHSRLVVEARELHRKAEEVEKRAAAVNEDIHEMAVNVPEPIDTKALGEEIGRAEQVAEVRRAFAARRAHLVTAQGAQETSEALSADIEAIDETVRDALAKAKLPGGIALDPQTRAVLLHGLPFAQAGTAEKIVASVETAMRLNPDLRVMLVDDGSELDQEHMDLLGEIAQEQDFQIWISRVSDDGKGPGFVIEDGTVANAPQQSMPITDAVIERAKQRRPSR